MGPSDKTRAEFMNTCGEVHAVWFGICESWNLFSIQTIPIEERLNLWQEWHYFLTGIVLGALAQALLVTVAAALLLGLAPAVVVLALASLIWAWDIFPRKRGKYLPLALVERAAYAELWNDPDTREILQHHEPTPPEEDAHHD